MTAAELLREYRGLRELWLDTGDGRYRTQLAYERYWRQACAEGRPPDSLLKVTGPEKERFFDAIIPGIDGHNYWGGGHRFRLDTGGERNPRYWWYEHLHGKLPRGSLKPACGELHCITPTHQQFANWAEVKQRYTDQQLLGSLQVVVMRLGHSPTVAEYDSQRGRGPTGTVIAQRFGGWPGALRAAGYQPSQKTVHGWSAAKCIEGLKFVSGLLGHPPSDRDYRNHAKVLKEHGLPVGTASIRAHVAPSWGAALKKAGLR